MSQMSLDIPGARRRMREMGPAVRNMESRFRGRLRELLNPAGNRPDCLFPIRAEVDQIVSALQAEFRQSVPLLLDGDGNTLFGPATLDELRDRIRIRLPETEVTTGLAFGRVAVASAVGAAVAGVLSSPSIWHSSAIRGQDLLGLVGAAVGAGIGVVAATAPLPMTGVLRRILRGRGLLEAGTLFLARRAVFGTLAALLVVLTAAGLYALLTGRGAVAVLAAGALGAIVFLRRWVQASGSSSGASVDSRIDHAASQLAEALRADAALAATLASIELRAPGQPGNSSAKLIAQLKESLITHGRLGPQVDPHDVLRAIASLLDMQWPSPAGAGSPLAPGREAEQACLPAAGDGPGRFQWSRQHEETYRPVGRVREGDWVRVMERPVVEADAAGTAVVLSKGRVVRED